MSEGGQPDSSLNPSLNETAETVWFYADSAINDSMDADRSIFPFKVEFNNRFLN